ncbi:5'-methylthioadenosine/S-adenosylhomocysteine nucleosidase family protein [Phytohabitans rumicis]|nr:hypothetical protein [Phytohabitans rumicis]
MQRFREFEIDLNRRSRVLLLVATASEREAVFAAAKAVTGSEPTKRFLPHHTVYELGLIGDAEVLLAQTQPGAVGPGAAAITASALISRLGPDFLVVTGICFGLREAEQRLGDVIVCRQLRAIDHRKEIDPDDGGPRIVLIRGDFVSSSVTLFDRFRSAEVGWTATKVHYGTLLSSSALVDSRELRADLRRLDPEASGGEMEGAGVYAAAAPEKVDWIVVKGISDWGYDKDDAAQEAAAGNAAAFVIGTIRSGALDERASRASLG